MRFRKAARREKEINFVYIIILLLWSFYNEYRLCYMRLLTAVYYNMRVGILGVKLLKDKR